MREQFYLILCVLFLQLSLTTASKSSEREDVLTAHANRQRTGWFAREDTLTPAALTQGRFGRLWESPELDGSDTFPARPQNPAV